MAGKRKNIHYLEKPIAGGKLFWQIEVRKETTFTTAGKVGSRVHEDSPVEHESSFAAYKYATQQVKQKKKYGYKEEGDPEDMGHQKPGKFNRSSDEQRAMVESVRKAAARARRMAHCQPTRDSDNDTDTDDTMSLSSTASLTVPNRGRNRDKIGVSPLNRRRSLRLEQKRLENAMVTLPLESQNTVEMKSPPVLERMETSTRWNVHRQKTPELSQQSTGPMTLAVHKPKPRLPKGVSRWVKHRGDVQLESQPTLSEMTGRKRPSLAISESDSDVSTLLKKKSTTFGLRHMLANTALSTPDVQPAGEWLGGVLPASSSASGRPRQKRKADVVLLSPPSTGPANVGDMIRLKKKVTIMPAISETSTNSVKNGADEVDGEPSTSENIGVFRPKRQATFNRSDSASSSATKAKRKRGALHRCESVICGGAIFVPPKEEWSLNLAAQVVWGVPIKDDRDQAKHALGVYVESRRCLIGDETGKIIELDASVTPSQNYQLHAGVKCIIEDEEFVYVGCDDGGVYDITHREPRLVCHCKEFGQLFALDVYRGMLAASDQHGNVALIDYSGAILWKKKSKGEFGWMVKMDDTGIFHGHSAGVTKYSILNGEQIWHLDTGDSILYGVQTEPFIYAACGNKVIKIDKYTGNILKNYNKGKTAHRTVHSNAVAGGLVFAGGNKIVCYDEDSGDVVYTLRHQLNPASMQYFQGRLFCVGRGALTVLDFTEEVIKNALAGNPVQTVEVTPNPVAPVFTPLKRVATIPKNHSEDGVLVQCVKPKARKGKLLVRVMSDGYNNSWDIQFPEELRSEGAQYLVQELRPSQSGGFYRVFGDIKQVDR